MISKCYSGHHCNTNNKNDNYHENIDGDDEDGDDDGCKCYSDDKWER